MNVQKTAHARSAQTCLAPFCYACHGPPADLGGAAYDDETDRTLLDKLFKFRRARAGAFEVRLLPVGASGRALPRDMQAFATALRARYPQGVLVAHEELRACFLFRASQPPRLLSLACALRLLYSKAAAGFALGERLRWLSVVRRNASF